MCFELAQYRASVPYPPVGVSAPNRRYAALLHNDYAGRSGELTGILQYVYQSMAPESIAAKIADALHYIAVVEMHHLDMLGELIFLLGGDAVYTGISRNQPVFWNAAMVYYSRNPQKILLRNIQGEKAAIANYRRSIGFISDSGVTDVLKRIILDEEHHIAIFEGLLKQLQNG